METPEIFPAAEDDGCEPFRKISAYLGCDEYLVIDAFRGVNLPEWDTPEHLDTVIKATKAYNEAERHAKNLWRTLRQLSQPDIASLAHAGCVTIAQIEHLAKTLENDYKSLEEWSRKRYRAGGRNPAAYAISEGIRRVFRRMRKKITFGVTADSAPSTEFTRAVEFALSAFGVKANFRGPSRVAYEEQLKISNRYRRCVLNKHESRRHNANSNIEK